ncbi:MAG: hypothetical protein KDD62_15230, partial [Bdellovibrionales bacterium]|nr:hypothetical protein [Bdellovibrionales bacterium]
RKRGDNHRRCLYIQGQGSEVCERAEIQVAVDLLYPDNPADRDPELFLGDSQRKIYKGIPLKLWLNDVSEKELTKETIKMRVPLSLEVLRTLL